METVWISYIKSNAKLLQGCKHALQIYLQVRREGFGAQTQCIA